MLGKLLDNKITFNVGIILFAAAIIVGGYFVLAPHDASYATAMATTTTIQETFSDDGTIDSDNSVSLAFQNSGIVSELKATVGENVTQGQILAVLDTNDLEAQLAGAQADVLSAQANLQALLNGATPQTVAVYSAAVSTAETSLSNAIRDAYTKSEDAILNKSDLLFNEGNSPNPTIVIPTDSSSIALQLNSYRVAIGTRISQWQTDIAADASSSSYDNLASESSADLSFIKNFLDKLTVETNRLTPGNSGLSQSAINAYITDINSAESEVNAATTELGSDMNSLASAEASKTEVQASSTSETIQEAESGVAKAQASVQAINAEIYNATIVAPFDGTVSSINIKVGQSVTAGAPAIAMTSNSGYKVDVYVPENKVASIKVGDMATLTFDAYGPSVIATATVATIDSSPTNVDGANAYKATLIFNGSNLGIRTGMTANAIILGTILPNVTAVPDSSVISSGISPFVLVKNARGLFIQTPVEIGVSAGGLTQITSGISPGQEVATFGTARDQ